MTTIPLFLAQIKRSRYESLPGPAAMRMLNDIFAVLLAFTFVLLAKLAIVKFAHLDFNLFAELENAEHAASYLCLFIVSYLWIGHRYGLYSSKPANSPYLEFRLICQSCFTAGVAVCGALYMFSGIEMSRTFVALLVSTSNVALIAQRYAKLLSSSKAEAARARTIAIVGSSQFSYVVSEHIRSNPHLDYNFLGFIRFPGCQQGVGVEESFVLGGVENIVELKQMHFIDEILITEYCPDTLAMTLIDKASDHGFGVSAVSGFYPHLTVNAPVGFLGDFPITSLHRTQPRTFALGIKRCVDVALSALALIIAAIPMAIVALVIKLDSEGPVFYISDRCGRRGRVFRCFKFRTMVEDADARKALLLDRNERDGILFKLTNDPRITRIGRFLRKYSIDEIPQLFNVLRGDMSLIGPRPPIPTEVGRYDLKHLHRLSVLPGITGLWQVKARTDASFARYIALDIAYVENWSPWLDMKILLRTIAIVIRGTGS